MGSHSNFDELFEKKINENLQNLKKKRSSYIKNLTEEKEKAIYEIIRFHSIRGGMSHQKLADIAELDRKSLRPYTKNLINKSKIIKNEKRLYVITESFYDDPILSAEVLGSSFSFLIKKYANRVLNNEKNTLLFTTDQRQVFPCDFTRYNDLFETKFSKNDNIEKMLFEFSNQIGSFIVYLLIFCMNPENQSKQKITKMEEHSIVNQMIFTGINQVTPYLLSAFTNFLKKTLTTLPSSKDGKETVRYESNGLTSIFLENNIVTKLLSSFVRLYPLMTYEFEKTVEKRYFFGQILKGCPSAMEYHKRWMDNYQKKLKEQESCKHKFKEPTMSIFGIYIKQCKKCAQINKLKQQELKSLKKSS